MIGLMISMRIEPLEMVLHSDEVEGALKSIDMPLNIRVRTARFEPGELVVDVSLFAPVPLYPTFRVSVVQAKGRTISLKVTAPLASQLINTLMSRIGSQLPHGVSYLGNGIINLDVPAFSNGLVSSIDIRGIQFQDGYAVMSINKIDLDILAMSNAGAVNGRKSV
jgi:hypothetical protein